MNKTAYIDFDGTVIDAMPRYYGVLVSYVNRFLAGTPDFNTYQHLKRRGFMDSEIASRLFHGFRMNVNEYLHYKRSRLEEMRWLKKDTLLGRPEEAFRLLHEDGYRVVLLTQRRLEENLNKQIELLELGRCLDEVVVVKPKIGHNVKADYISGNKIQESIIIGDGKVEMDAAKILHIKGYFVESGLFYADTAGVKEAIFPNFNKAVECITGNGGSYGIY